MTIRLRIPGGRPATDRAMRSLAFLQASASTSRTLNLLAVWRAHSETEAYRKQPFFRNALLNRSIIVKHRLRQHESELVRGRASATKVILPIDSTDLRAGARSFFVEQLNYMAILDDLYGLNDEGRAHDEAMLEALDGLPSLDPFIMREHLRKLGMEPARCYFDLTEADNARVFSFVRDELKPLIGLSFNGVDAKLNEKTSKLAALILANAAEGELEPLRRGMDISAAVFEEGMFCWKGFIYYKWTLSTLLPQVQPVSREINAIKLAAGATGEEKALVVHARGRIGRGISRAGNTVRTTLKIYDDAYADLTRNGQPQSFRDFLLKAPSLFQELGERLGALHHIVSFWRFRFPEGGRLPTISAEDLIDLLADFEGSLNFDDADLDRSAPMIFE